MARRRKRRTWWGYAWIFIGAGKAGLVESWNHRKDPEPGAYGTLAFVKALYEKLGIKTKAGE